MITDIKVTFSNEMILFRFEMALSKQESKRNTKHYSVNPLSLKCNWVLRCLWTFILNVWRRNKTKKLWKLCYDPAENHRVIVKCNRK